MHAMFRAQAFAGRALRVVTEWADVKYQKMLGLKVTEDMGTVTGTHIAGTGDDSSTVLVKNKKKKKKDIQIRFKLKNQKSLRKRIIDNVLAIQQKV